MITLASGIGWTPSTSSMVFQEPQVVFLAFWATFINAAFSYLGIEIVALAAAEVENPHCNVPRSRSALSS